MKLLLLMMMKFHFDVGEAALSSELSPLLSGFTGLCGESTGF